MQVTTRRVLPDIQYWPYGLRMADDSKIKPTTAFTRAFAAGLRTVMAARGASQQAVADAIGRNQGFVSERTSGKRACDTDIIAGVADVVGVEPRTIVREVLAAMESHRDELAEKRAATRIPAVAQKAARKQPKPRPGT